MWIEQIDFLAIFFELTLFALFAIVIWRLLKNYILPALYGEIKAIKKHQKDLRDKDALLKASKQRLEGQLKEQEDRFFLLDKKMQLWHQAFVDKNKEKEEENELILKKVEEKREKQFAHFSLSKMQRVVAPQAVEAAYHEMTKLHEEEESLVLLKELIEKIQPTGKKAVGLKR